jgi:CHASE3 domain sensor protein
MSDSAESEEALRQRLAQVEAEKAQAFDGRKGFLGIGDPEYVGRLHELEREADELRVRLGMPRVGPPPQTGKAALRGWLLLAGCIAAIFVIVYLAVALPA